MYLISVLFCSILILAFAEAGIPIKACKPEDTNCLGEAAREFVKNTANGLPEYECKAVDPMTIDQMTFERPGVTVTTKNMKVTGMKNLKLVGFKLDEVAKRTEFNMTMNLDVDIQDMKLLFTELKKEFTGSEKAKLSVECRTGYNWDVVKDETGEHYRIDEETTTCDTLSPPEVTLNPELIAQLKNEPEINKNWEEGKEGIIEKRRIGMIKIAEKVFSVMIGNFRNAAKKLLTSDFIAK